MSDWVTVIARVAAFCVAFGFGMLRQKYDWIWYRRLAYTIGAYLIYFELLTKLGGMKP
jgi:hypothetical protein